MPDFVDGALNLIITDSSIGSCVRRGIAHCRFDVAHDVAHKARNQVHGSSTRLHARDGCG